MSLLLLLTALLGVGFHHSLQIKSTPSDSEAAGFHSQYGAGKIIRLDVLGTQGREPWRTQTLIILTQKVSSFSWLNASRFVLPFAWFPKPWNCFCHFAQFDILFWGVRICQPFHSAIARSPTQYILSKYNHTAHSVFYTEKSIYSRFSISFLNLISCLLLAAFLNSQIELWGPLPPLS